jgi:hypothetical protein
MGNPITLDFSKAQPLAPANPDASTSTAVKLDFSKAQRLPPPAGTYQTKTSHTLVTPGMGEQPTPGVPGRPTIVPIPGETFEETMRRGMAVSPTPQDIQQATAAAGKQAPLALAAASLPSLGAGVAALMAPTVGTATVGTGILGPAGEELTRDIATQGPSLARAGLNLAINAIKAHPYISGAIALRLSKALGLPVDKIAKALLGMGGATE